MEVLNCPCYKDEFTCRENSLIMQSCKDNENCFIKKFLKQANQEWILEYFGVEEND